MSTPPTTSYRRKIAVRLRALCVLSAIGLFAAGVFTTSRAIAPDASKIVGPNACAECHTREAETWQQSHHFKTFREMPRRKEADQIAKNLGIQRVRSDSLCLGCHYTVQKKDNSSQPIAGISCESCHGAAQEWIKVHSTFSGKTEKTESKAEKEARWKVAQSKGMIRPSSLYLLAKNCYGCHVVPKEELVNTGGHPAGSAFELVSWSQGEVRHNTWHSKGNDNVPAGAARRRMLYLIGLGVELETSLRSVGEATVRFQYAFEMAKRVDRARKQLAAAAKAAPNVPEIATLVQFGHSAGLKLNNKSALNAAADGVAKTLAAIADKYDGTTLAALDPLIPGPDKLKGTAK